MNSDDSEILPIESRLHGIEPGKRPVAVPALEGPEIHKHYSATQRLDGERFRIDPVLRAFVGKIWRNCGRIGQDSTRREHVGDYQHDAENNQILLVEEYDFLSS